MAKGPVVEIRLDASKLHKLKGSLVDRAHKILNLSAANIQAKAIINTVRVDTGAMKNGWYVMGGGGQTMSGAIGKAFGLRAARGETAPLADLPPDPSTPYERVIGNVMEYAIHHEFGTSRGLSATPMLRPAVEDERMRLEERWKELFADV